MHGISSAKDKAIMLERFSPDFGSPARRYVVNGCSTVVYAISILQRVVEKTPRFRQDSVPCGE